MLERWDSFRKMAEQLSLLELLERPSIEALFKPDMIFESDDQEFLRSLKEDTRFDRKSNRADQSALASLLSAFGNGPAIEGGVIAVGIEDNGSILGCKRLSQNRLAEIESCGRDRCHDGRFTARRVAVTNSSGEDDFIVLIRVYYVENRLVECTDGSAYCREGDRSRRLSELEKQECRINKGERAFELEQCALKYPDDFRMADIARFAKQIRSTRDGSPNISDEEVLQSMRMGRIRDGQFFPNNVCVWMFAQDPQIAFPGAYIHF